MLGLGNQRKFASRVVRSAAWITQGLIAFHSIYPKDLDSKLRDGIVNWA